MNTLRAYMGSDTALVVWIRDEAGKVDLADGDECVLYLYPYGSSVKVEETGIAGTLAGATDGKLNFTITESYADTNLKPGLFRYSAYLEGSRKADGLLEVV